MKPIRRITREDVNLSFLTRNLLLSLQGGSAGAHGEMEREVRIFMQNERQRVHGCARSVHFKDICEKGESKFTFRVNIVVGLRARRKKDREISLDFCFHDRFTLRLYSHARCHRARSDYEITFLPYLFFILCFIYKISKR